MSLFSHHSIDIKSALVLMWMSSLFSFILLVLGLVACNTCLAWQSHNSKSVYLRSHHIIQGKKRNCLCIVHAHVLISSLSMLSLSHGLLSHAVPCTVSSSQSILSCHVYPSGSHSLKIFMLKRFFGMYCLKITLPLKEKNYFVNSQIFGRVIKFGNCAI